MMSRVLRRSVGVARLHTSLPRRNLIQDLYVSEIKAFKPKPASEKDAAQVVVPWKIPTAPKTPAVEGEAAEVDAYANAPVDVESSASGSSAESTSGDWFPIEDDAEPEQH